MKRAGTYELQAGGYAAFIPSVLPPDPPLRSTPDMRDLLDHASNSIARLDGALTTLPKTELFVPMFARVEAIASSAIEGVESSLDDVVAGAMAALVSPRNRDLESILSYLEAFNHGIDRVAGSGLSVLLMREMHALLMVGDPAMKRQPGELRINQNWVGGPGSTLRNASYVPPPPSVVPQAMRDLETFIQQQRMLPDLIQAALIHAQFQSIHPFEDGNGRMGRMLTSLLLLDRGLLARPVLGLSRYLRRRRVEYYDRLQAVRDDGDWEGWIMFFLAGALETAEEAIQQCQAIVSLREAHRDLLAQTFGRTTSTGLIVLEELYARPFTSVNRIRVLIGVTFAAANNLVEKFVEAGILKEYTGQSRNRRFRYDEYLQVFE